jgi:hypothetical protein
MYAAYMMYFRTNCGEIVKAFQLHVWFFGTVQAEQKLERLGQICHNICREMVALLCRNKDPNVEHASITWRPTRAALMGHHIHAQ